MKTFKLTLMVLMAAMLSACNAQSSEKQETATAGDGEVEVYYFHFTSRCATCNAVENETKVALDMYFGDQVKAGDISFVSLNLDEADGKKMAEQLKVSGQTLLLVSGAQKVNLTNDGFMNARSNAGKFHEIIKSNIDKLL